jgi:hypothetical protein
VQTQKRQAAEQLHDPPKRPMKGVAEILLGERKRRQESVRGSADFFVTALVFAW